MTTVKTFQSFRLPYRPEHEPDDMAKCRQLNATNIIELLRHNLGNRETTLITGDQYLCPVVPPRLAGARYLELMIAFNADLEARRNNGYVIAEHGKPPDFAMEIASTITGSDDSGKNRGITSATASPNTGGYGIPEYRCFDETPTRRWHGAPLAGDRLAAAVTNPFLSNTCPATSGKATAGHWTSICAGSKASSSGTTRQPAATYQLLTKKGNAPARSRVIVRCPNNKRIKSVKSVWRLKNRLIKNEKSVY